MKKFLILISAALLTLSGIEARASVNDDDPVTFDVRGGMTVNNIYCKLNNGSSGNLGKRGMGFYVSGNVDFQLANSLFLESGLGLLSRTTVDQTVIFGEKYSAVFAEIPLLLSLRNTYGDIDGFVDFGLYSDFGLTGKCTYDGYKTSDYFGDNGFMKRVNAGILVGLGCTWEQLFFGVRYQQDFASASSDSAVNLYGKLYYSTFSLQIGYVF